MNHPKMRCATPRHSARWLLATLVLGACGGEAGQGQVTAGSASQVPTPIPAESAVVSAASLSVGKVNIEGDVIEKHVLRRLEDGRAKLLKCYQSALDRRPGMKGRIIFTVALDAAGSVARADVAGARFPDPTVGLCMSKELAKLQFPASPGATTSTVMIPIILAPAAADDPTGE